jgi:hypothetical protein
VVIKDLEYLKTVTQDVSGGFRRSRNYSKIYFSAYYSIRKHFASRNKFFSSLGTPEGNTYSNAYAKGSLTQTFFRVTPYSSKSISIAAID